MDEQTQNQKRREAKQKEIRDARYVFLKVLEDGHKTLRELREVLAIPDDLFTRFLIDMEERGLIRANTGHQSVTVWKVTEEGERELNIYLKS